MGRGQGQQQAPVHHGSEPWLDAWMVPMQERLLLLGLDACACTTWRVDPKQHCTPRTFASTSSCGSNITVAPEMQGLDPEHQDAILRHEWGHVVDMLYQGYVRCVRGEVLLLDKLTIAKWEAWQERPTPQVERTADALAEGLFGQPIRYRGPLLLQAFSGQKRPAWLR